MEHEMHWTEAWVRTATSRWRPHLERLAHHRQPANAISENAVLIGVTATVGLAAVAAFMLGLGQVLTRALARIGGQVP